MSPVRGRRPRSNLSSLGLAEVLLKAVLAAIPGQIEKVFDWCDQARWVLLANCVHPSREVVHLAP